MDEVQDEQTNIASTQIGSNLRAIRKEKKLSWHALLGSVTFMKLILLMF